MAREIVYVRTGTPGLLAGTMACIFAVLGIFSFGLIFVPIAALCTAIGIFNGIVHFSLTGIMVSMIGGLLTFWGMVTSPVLLLVLGVGAASSIGGGH